MVSLVLNGLHGTLLSIMEGIDTFPHDSVPPRYSPICPTSKLLRALFIVTEEPEALIAEAIESQRSLPERWRIPKLRISPAHGRHREHG